MKRIYFMTIIVFFLGAISVQADEFEWTPFQISLVSPLQIFSEETDVQGLRINLLYGANKNVSGIDIGPINRTIDTTRGMQLGLFPFGGINITKALEGVHLGGIFGGVNVATGDVIGVQLAGVLGAMNMAQDLNGLQISGLVFGMNIAKNTKGAQLTTLYNQAEEMRGLQIGLVNISRQLSGIQIGLVNIVKESDIPFLPIINAGF